MKYRLAVFDMDGTILNTLGDISASVNFALRAEHMPERTMAEIRGFVGNGVRRLIELSVPSDASQEACERVYNAFAAAVSAAFIGFGNGSVTFVGKALFGHGVIAAGMIRIATRHTADRQHKSGKKAPFPEGLQRIRRTTGHKPAAGSSLQRRQKFSVKANKQYGKIFHLFTAFSPGTAA